MKFEEAKALLMSTRGDFDEERYSSGGTVEFHFIGGVTLLVKYNADHDYDSVTREQAMIKLVLLVGVLAPCVKLATA